MHEVGISKCQAFLITGFQFPSGCILFAKTANSKLLDIFRIYIEKWRRIYICVCVYIYKYLCKYIDIRGFPGGIVVKSLSENARDTREVGLIDPWVGKIPWRSKWQPIPVSLPEKSLWTEEPGGLQSMGSQSFGYG